LRIAYVLPVDRYYAWRQVDYVVTRSCWWSSFRSSQRIASRIHAEKRRAWTTVGSRNLATWTWPWAHMGLWNELTIDLREPRHLSHMAVHHLHHQVHYHRLHLLLLAQYFILNLRLGSSANPFLHRPFPFLPDWFHGLSDHLMILLCSTAEFVCMVCKTKAAYSRFSNAL